MCINQDSWFEISVFKILQNINKIFSAVILLIHATENIYIIFMGSFNAANLSDLPVNHVCGNGNIYLRIVKIQKVDVL